MCGKGAVLNGGGNEEGSWGKEKNEGEGEGGGGRGEGEGEVARISCTKGLCGTACSALQVLVVFAFVARAVFDVKQCAAEYSVGCTNTS